MSERNDVERVVEEAHGLLDVHSGEEGDPRHDVGASLNEFLTEAHEVEDLHHAGLLTDEEVPETPGEVLVEVGQDVVCRDGAKLGEVVDVRDDVIVVERGFLVPEDVFVPRGHVVAVDHHGITLDCDRDAADDPAWRDDPLGDPEAELEDDGDLAYTPI